ncbi:MAG: hypothetical protein AB9834_09755 [Lentimicrobium sp.]
MYMAINQLKTMKIPVPYCSTIIILYGKGAREKKRKKRQQVNVALAEEEKQ